MNSEQALSNVRPEAEAAAIHASPTKTKVETEVSIWDVINHKDDYSEIISKRKHQQQNDDDSIDSGTKSVLMELAKENKMKKEEKIKSNALVLPNDDQSVGSLDSDTKSALMDIVRDSFMTPQSTKPKLDLCQANNTSLSTSLSKPKIKKSASMKETTAKSKTKKKKKNASSSLVDSEKEKKKTTSGIDACVSREKKKDTKEKKKTSVIDIKNDDSSTSSLDSETKSALMDLALMSFSTPQPVKPKLDLGQANKTTESGISSKPKIKKSSSTKELAGRSKKKKKGKLKSPGDIKETKKEKKKNKDSPIFSSGNEGGEVTTANTDGTIDLKDGSRALSPGSETKSTPKPGKLKKSSSLNAKTKNTTPKSKKKKANSLVDMNNDKSESTPYLGISTLSPRKEVKKDEEDEKKDESNQVAGHDKTTRPSWSKLATGLFTSRRRQRHATSESPA